MTQARRLDRDVTATDRRYITRSENEDEAVDLAKAHVRDVHWKEYTVEELRSKYAQIVQQ